MTTKTPTPYASPRTIHILARIGSQRPPNPWTAAMTMLIANCRRKPEAKVNGSSVRALDQEAH